MPRTIYAYNGLPHHVNPIPIISLEAVIISAVPMRWLERAEIMMYPRRSEDHAAGMGEAVKGLIALIRPINASMMAFAVLVGAVLAEGGWPNIGLAKLAAGMATGFLVLGSAMVFNDYADVDIDMINEPWRPLPRGVVSLRGALVYGILLGAAGMITAAYTGVYTLILAASSWLISIAYDFKGKATGLPGNFMVSFNVAMPIAYGAALVSRLDEDILVFWLMIFLANTGREITKGIVDVPGDRQRGIRTIAVTMGERKAALIASFFVLAAVALSPLPYIEGEASPYYVVVAAADAGFLYSTYLILANPDRMHARRAKTIMLYSMLIGLVSFLLARIALG